MLQLTSNKKTLYQIQTTVLLLFFVQCYLHGEIEPNPINWADKITYDSLYSAESTWSDYFKDLHPSINATAFFNAAAHGVYQNTTIQELLALGMENHRLRSYDCSQTAELAYPKHDRPRNETDINSVRYLSTTKDPISPIVLVQFFDRKGRKHLIKLDGMHRLVAACIRRSPVRCFIIDLGRASRLKNTKAFFKNLFSFNS